MDPNSGDLALLELLKQDEPAIITVSGDAVSFKKRYDVQQKSYAVVQQWNS